MWGHAPPEELGEGDPVGESQSPDASSLQYSSVLQLHLDFLRVEVSGAVLCVRSDTPAR